MEIHVLHRQGKSIRAISQELRVSRNTVRRYLRDVAKTPRYTPRAARPSKLAPYYGYLNSRIAAAKPDWIPATVLYREIVSLEYTGKQGILKNYIRAFKTTTTPDPVQRFETAPGEQMQVDFTTVGRGRKKLKALVAILGYSRATYVRFSEHERQQDWLDGIEGALSYFGGVPRELLFDNAKCIMIERDAYGEGSHRWNAALLQMSRDYGFRLRACRPYRAKTKGKVERFNGYLKRSFMTPLQATLKQSGLRLDVDLANGQIGAWLHDIANERIHATTGKKPRILLEQEQHHLQPLPRQADSASPPIVIHHAQAIPVESFQHPLSVYDRLLEIAL